MKSQNDIILYDRDFTLSKDFIQVYITSSGNNYPEPIEFYVDNIKITDGTTEDVIDGGIGNKVAFKYRIQDVSIGRFLSIDPLAKQYPWYSPYQFGGNTPVMAIDIEGLEEHIVIHEQYENRESEITVVKWNEVFPDQEHGRLGTGVLEIELDPDKQLKRVQYRPSLRDEFLNITGFLDIPDVLQWGSGRLIDEVAGERDDFPDFVWNSKNFIETLGLIKGSGGREIDKVSPKYKPKSYSSDNDSKASSAKRHSKFPYEDDIHSNTSEGEMIKRPLENGDTSVLEKKKGDKWFKQTGVIKKKEVK